MITIPPAKHASERRKVRPTAANANLERVLLLASGALLLMFDGEVDVDVDHPPTTWSFNGITSIQPGSLHFGASTYIILNGSAGSGDPVVIAADDPGARTPDGGYVNGVVTVVSDL
jgi:hypothetical protein